VEEEYLMTAIQMNLVMKILMVIKLMDVAIMVVVVDFLFTTSSLGMSTS